MKKISYSQLMDIVHEENALTIKDLSVVISELIHSADDEFGEYGEFEYDKSVRKKLRELAEFLADETITIYADSTDYHNLAVDYARQDLFDCSISILKRGLKKYPMSPTLLADTILYGKESGIHEECEKALSSLFLVDKSSWEWRAYSFTIDYYLDKISRLPKGPDRNKLKKEILKLSDEFIAYSEYDNEAIDRAFCKKADVIKELGGDKTQEFYLEEGSKKSSPAPLCSLRLADIMFARGKYDVVLTYLQKCKYAIIDPQPDINPAYVYLLYAMAKTSKLMIDTPDGNYATKKTEVENIYKDFHTATKSFPINQLYEDAANRTIRMLEIQTGIKDRTSDPDENDY